MEDQNEIIIYSGADGGTRIEVKFTGETVWLSQQQLCELYATSKANVSEHIKHIFEDAELDKESVVRKFRTTAADGKSYNVTFYNLDATAVDYDPRSETSVKFFKIVQNKLHFAAHGHTASELIFKRADADAPMMGLTSFKGDHPTLRDAQIAKNYLSENELKILNNLVSGYFDFAEIQAMKRRPVYMSDYVRQLDTILSSTGEALLNGPGTVSHQQAMDKAREEYRKFQIRELSPVEHAYLDTIKALNAKAAKK